MLLVYFTLFWRMAMESNKVEMLVENVEKLKKIRDMRQQ